MLILRIASLLIPQRMRAEWLAEWRAEAWYVRERSRQSPTLFCLGAIPDAICVWRSTSSEAPWLQSPKACLALLAAIGAAGITLLALLPGGLDTQMPTRGRHIEGLVALWRDGRPTVPTHVLRALKDAETGLPFSSIAFYSAAANLETEGVGRLLTVRVTPSIVDVLEVPTRSTAQNGVETILLTRTAWEKKFNRDSRILGKSIDIDGRPARIIAILPVGWWSHAAEVDALLLDDNVLDDENRAFALAKLKADRPPGRVRLPLRFMAVSITDRFSTTASLFLFTTMIAVVILPVATTLSLGELPHHACRRWGFFLLKLALIALIAYCGVAYLVHLRTEDVNASLLPHFYITAYVFALRWAIRDQRSRCPVCLKPLTNPVGIGGNSRIFLESNITEVVCSRGHGLMHIPETPTSWFAVQRWSNLDASWSSLFTHHTSP